MKELREIDPYAFTVSPYSAIAKEKMILTAENGEGESNPMTVSWGGFCVLFGEPTVLYAVRPERFTYSFCESGNRISLCFLRPEYEKILAYCGSHSGREGAKISRAGLHPFALPCGGIGYEEAKLIVSGEKCCSVPLQEESFPGHGIPEKWYAKDGYHTLYFATVKAIFEVV